MAAAYAVPLGTVLVGAVTRYDADAGLGEVATGDRTYPFHCTAIADGSRLIEVGRAVAIVIGPGGPGRWEAVAVRPLQATG